MKRRTGLVIATVVGVLLGPAAPSGATTPYPDAVVLVSGFDTETAFTTPDPSCKGKEGDEWNPPTGVAAALRANGKSVFTAPVRQGGSQGLPPCNPDGPAPPQSAYINSNGELDANGAALAGLFAFLRDSYGVRRAQLVAHSDGGLWSRSAITQRAPYSGLALRSLTTLGTPHTGSFIADIAVATRDGRCDFDNLFVQGLCESVQEVVKLVIEDIGPTATRQLTDDFLATWNPKQEIGSCRVTTIGGTYVGFEAGFDYYMPSDGLVGKASALAQTAQDFELHPIPAPPIPDLRGGGTFPVVHGDSLSFLSKDNLLNTQAISDKVVEIVDGTPPSGPLCNAPPALGAGAAAEQVHLRLPLKRLIVPTRRGRLPVPGREDMVVAQRGVGVSCGRLRRLHRTGLLGSRRIHAVSTFACNRRLRVRRSGKTTRSGALLVRSHRDRDVTVRTRGDRLRVRVRGRRASRIRAAVRHRGEWRRLRLDRRGRGTLPRGGERTQLRVRVTARPGQRPWTATATLRR